ncbi:hypothetical protein WA026_012980 [Henosepilachna vigintioctopunctata]|uniref:Uncharacterized protein n=1 Tax=Henosepilachna vigintioctopunctata TaxID=420089 RepID=A0AAW1TMQ5_9CUCU
METKLLGQEEAAIKFPSPRHPVHRHYSDLLSRFDVIGPLSYGDTEENAPLILDGQQFSVMKSDELVVIHIENQLISLAVQFSPLTCILNFMLNLPTTFSRDHDCPIVLNHNIFSHMEIELVIHEEIEEKKYQIRTLRPG